MRNLRNIRRSITTFVNEELPLTATAWDASSDSLICAFGPCEASAILELRRLNYDAKQNEELSLIASWDAPCPHPDLPFDQILSLRYFPDTSTSCLVLAGGDIVIVREESLPGEDLIEIVGSVDAGITAAAWSPDEELLAISTRASTFLYMTRDFENVTNITFSPDDVKASNHVSVGWGKAETQFRGKRAKALRDPTMPERVDEGVLSPKDDGSVTISWRGDGAFVAVNSVEGGKRRMIRVYSRDGVLDSVTEPVDYLEGALSWRPAGNLMAGIQRLQDRVDVVFFERNGLRHGQFSLRLSAEELETWGSSIALEWNNDSTVLAVCFIDRVQLWTMGNYHYYLKQEIQTLSAQPTMKSTSTCWHPEKPLQLAMGAHDVVQRLAYVFTVAAGPTSPPNDYGTVAVIDGKLLKLTPLRLANVPPPMARHEVHLAQNAIDVAISSSGTCIAALHEDQVCIYAYDLTSKPISEPIIERSFVLPPSVPHPRQVAFTSDSDVYVLLGSVGPISDSVCYFSSGGDSEGNYKEIGLQESITIFPTLDYQSICIQAKDGSVISLNPDVTEERTAQFKTITVAKLPVVCPWVELVHQADRDIAFGLTVSGALYANGRLLVRNCTSFLLTPAHLVFTTTQHLLKFVHLTAVEDLEIPLDEPEKDERCRSIERGAKLVTIMPTAYSLTLQMPRGNLETIYPRALVLAGIRRSIAAKDYKTAFFACRNQRVDMNILHDHAPEQFMDSVELFVNQIRKVEHIDLFLSQLREEDVSQTMYKETLKSRADQPTLTNGVNGVNGVKKIVAPDPTSKVNRICDAFLQVLQGRTATHLQNIITANVCKSPPDLDAGLEVVGKLQEQKDDLAETAAEHICFLADVNQLYDHALGLYNLDLALLIAQQSQKDPREYLPYLQSLQEMPLLRRKFTIDDHLGRYSKALSHLHSLEATQELQGYVQKHELYAAALNLYKYQQEHLNSIMRLYADFLNSRNRFKEAGIAYEYLNDHASATTAYRAAHLWRDSLSSATLIPLPPTELQTLAQTLATGLIESKDFFAAATIHLDYLRDVETAVKLFCRGYWFAEAMRVIGLHGRRELLESVVDVGLVEGLGSMTELLAECRGQISAQVPRLRELRRKKAEDPLSFFGGTTAGAEDGGPDIPDNVSLAPTDASTSGGTFMTRYTGRTGSGSTMNTQTTRRTSKNRRREERKRARGKKGSVYEEEYLVNSIGRLIERVNSVSDEVRRLVEGLMRRGMRERAGAVEKAMVEVVEACEGCVGEVFQVEEKKTERASEEGEEVRPGGADGVLWDAVEAGGRPREAPVVKAFERLSLLG
ncbi:putative elongator complex protein 1 [Coniosporium tulheliwenetii]|uniref:Elongator complex protein 1 n=1 Tax=Coniosporium tulheliwenetii TaxID=3383036 RepID=A0ACC2Z4E8_9PEZI|nr:putative elongator complex protein 1 [Cladosporium sp. JES 115]